LFVAAVFFVLWPFLCSFDFIYLLVFVLCLFALSSSVHS
jgi:hypothetical protein